MKKELINPYGQDIGFLLQVYKNTRAGIPSLLQFIVQNDTGSHTFVLLRTPAYLILSVIILFPKIAYKRTGAIMLF